MAVQLSGEGLTIEAIEQVARHNERLEYSQQGIENIEKCRKVVEGLVAKDIAIYGVTTGIGEFARIRISAEQSSELQRRIIYSHAAGTGKPIKEDVIRGMMMLRGNVLAKGYSGVRMKIAQILIQPVEEV